MSEEEVTKKQHYVPRFYLKLFADQQGSLQVLDLKGGRMGKPKSCSAVGYEPYFYAVETGVPDEASQYVEKWLQQLEDIIARELPGIIKRILNGDHIDDGDRYTLSVLMSMLWLRSPIMRAQTNQMAEDMTKKLMRFYVPESLKKYTKETGVALSEKEKAELAKTIKNGSYGLRFNNAQHLRLMVETLGFDGPGFTNMFFGQKWKIYIARGKKRFITIDSPIVEWWPPPQTFYGPSFLERKKYFSLTPEILFELSYPLGSKKAKRKTLFESEDNTVTLFNILLAAHAYGFAFSSNRVILEGILSGRTKPGVVEKIYYEKFELPWEQARRTGRA